MADVSVEFGATDVGLEKALQQIQTEMANLQGKVKSGELSFEELEATMKRIGQVEVMERRLKAIGDSSAESSPKVKKLGEDISTSGEKSQSAAGLFDESFQKISAAFTLGNLAAEGFQKVVDLAFTAALAVVDAFGDALDLGGRLNELSARTGETAGSLLILEQAFRDSGLSADQVGTAINKLQNFMADAAAGGDRQTQAMQRLGVTLADLSGKTPTEQMGIFADAINRIPDPTGRAAAASEVFGEKLGGRLLPLLKDFSPNLDAASDKVGSLAQIMDKNAATFDKAGETIEAVQGKLTAFAAGILSQTIPAIEDLGTAMENVDAAELGKEVGESLVPALERVGDLIAGVTVLLDKLSQANKSAATDSSILGDTYRGVTASLDGFNKMMNDVFTYFTPFGAGMEILRRRGEELRDSQNEASTEIKNTGDAIVATLPLVGEFNASLSDAQPSFAGVAEQTNLIGGDFDKISKKLNEEIIPATEKMQQLEGQRAEAEKERLARLEESKEKTREQFELELQIVEAKASGNEQTAKNLENQKLFNAELDKLIKAGFGEPEARAMAQRMVDARVEAGKLSGHTETAATNTKTFASWLDYIEGTQPEEPVKKMSEKAADARKEIEAFGQYIGTDLSGMSFPDIAKKLGVDTIGTTGSDQIDAILSHLDSERQKLQGIIPVDESGSKTKIDELGTHLEKNFKKSVDLALNGSDGSKILSEVKTLVSGIKDLVAKIEPKLPQQALAY